MSTVTFRQELLEQGIDLGQVEEYDPETGTGGGTGTRYTEEELANMPELPHGTGWPSAVPIRPANWNVPLCTYKLAYGDTLSGLAATYLNSPQRWSEIWAEQSDVMRSTRSPDKLNAGEWIAMPQEALATMLASVERGSGGGVGITNGTAQGGNGAAKKSNTTAIVVGVGALAALGLLYLATR